MRRLLVFTALILTVILIASCGEILPPETGTTVSQREQASSLDSSSDPQGGDDAADSEGDGSGTDISIDAVESETDESVDSSVDTDGSETDESVDSSVDTDGSETDESVDSSVDTDGSETDESVDSSVDTDGSETDESVDTDETVESVDSSTDSTDSSSDNGTEPPADEGVDYIDFEMKDMDGNTVKLSDFLDKPVVLNFWASWCPPCKAEMPDFEEAYNSHGEYINFVMVSVDYTYSAAKNFFASSGYTFPAFYDFDEQGGDAYYISSIPQTLFITTSGKIVDSFQRMIYKQELEDGIQLLKDLHGITQRPTVPDRDIEIAKDGESEYVIVYDATDIRVEEFAQKIADYLKTKRGVTLEIKSQEDAANEEKCIYIGDVKGIARVKRKLGEIDFAACVSGDSYVLYATNSRLYEYLYEIFTTKILPPVNEGNWSAKTEEAFIYSQSEYKNVSYVDYLINKNGGSFTYELMLELFEERTFVGSDSTVLKYRIYIPYEYSSSDLLPVLTILHGAGERGNNNTAQMQNMVFNLFKNRENPVWNSIVVCPQCPSWPEQWVDTPWAEGSYSVDEVPESNEAKTVLEILGYVKDTLQTDENRYYITGLSMGGFGTWDMIMRHREIFAAAVPICGGADPTQAEKLVDMPIYTFHGTADSSVPFLGTKEMVDAIEEAGGEKILHEYLNGYGHIIWGYVGDKLEVWEWLYSQSLK